MTEFTRERENDNADFARGKLKALFGSSSSRPSSRWVPLVTKKGHAHTSVDIEVPVINQATQPEPLKLGRPDFRQMFPGVRRDESGRKASASDLLAALGYRSNDNTGRTLAAHGLTPTLGNLPTSRHRRGPRMFVITGNEAARFVLACGRGTDGQRSWAAWRTEKDEQARQDRAAAAQAQAVAAVSTAEAAQPFAAPPAEPSAFDVARAQVRALSAADRQRLSQLMFLDEV